MDLGVIFILALTVFYLWTHIGIKNLIILLCIAPFAIALLLKMEIWIAPPCFFVAWLLRNKDD